MSGFQWPQVMATAHRNLPVRARPWIQRELRRVAKKLRDERGCRRAVSGMALGGDMDWAQAALDAGLQLYAAVPYPQQAWCPVAPANQEWTDEQRQCWQDLIARADETVLVSDVDPATMDGRTRMLHQRNDHMLAISNAVVAVWDARRANGGPRSPRGGTYSTVLKAVSAGKPVVWIDPNMANWETQDKPKTTLPSPRRWSEILGIPVGVPNLRDVA